MIDSGASSDFIDTEFARKCGLELSPSNCTIRLADGSVVSASGQATVNFHLVAAHGKPAIPCTTTFTVTPLQGYDAILGLTWLETHDVLVGWRNRTIEVRTPGQPKQHIKPIECVSDPAPMKIASMTTKGLARAHRRGEVEEMYAIFVQPKKNSTPETSKRHPMEASLLKEFEDVFPEQLPSGLPPTRGVQHRIELKPGSTPPQVRPLHHQSSKDLAVFEEYTRSMIEAGQLRVSNSPYGAMALIVRKKDGTARVVVDYRALNEQTIKNKYPLPLMDELFDRVVNAKVFSKLDLRNGFHQIRVHEDDVEKTAFRTRYGSFEYLVLPMGLSNAPGTFMQLMNDTFRDLLDRSVLVFLDDILIYSDTIEHHQAHVRQVLERLRSAKLYAKLSKCEFFKDEVEFLGHHIGAKGLTVMADKVNAVKEWPQPKNVSDVRSFLGLAGFYRRFVKDFSEMVLPITELTKTVTGAPFEWGTKQDAAFSKLKEALTNAPVLLIADPKLPYTLNCDACDYAIGATLQQDQGNGLLPVAYMSRKLTPAEVNYDTREKEFLALVDACRHWRQYLHSEIPFKLLSDHDSLKYHKTMPNLSGRLARWVERMAEFDYTIEHIAGVKNIVADALSRRIDMKDQVREETVAAARMNARPIESAAVVGIRRIQDRAAAETVMPPAPNRPQPNAAGVIVMPSHRCTADAKSGEQCKARTAMGQYCWNHLRTISGLRIKKSTIPNGGKGLFAARKLQRGYRIDYTGDRIRLEGNNGGSYYLELSQRTGIDAARTNSGEGRWINDPRGTDKMPNCQFCLYTPPGRPRIGCVRTTRPIEIGEELLIRYGRAYWNFFADQQQNQGNRRSRKIGQLVENEVIPLPAGVEDGNGRLRKRLVGPRKAVLATVSIDSSLEDAIIVASTRDPLYCAQLSNPPSNMIINKGLLWDSAGGQLQVPNDSVLRTRILAHCHDDPTGAHFGRDKTIAALQQRFSWTGMATAAGLYVSTCDACQRNKPSQQLTPGILMPLRIPDYPCQEWTNDAVTGLPTTRRGNDAIQVYVERLCKLKHFVATKKSDDAKEMARVFIHTVVRAHGVPETIISDRDPRFTANYYAELLRLLGVKVSMSTARHPQSDGQSEREIKTMITALRAYCNDHQDDWDDHLDMLELGFNSAVQSSTQYSPHELLYGAKARLPIDAAISSLTPRNPAAIDRASAMKIAMQYAREHLKKAQVNQIRNADRRVSSFSVGEKVLLSTTGLTLRGFDNKLAPRFIGPFTVTAVVNANAYTIELPSSLRALHPTFNIDKLKKYVESDEFGTRPIKHDRPPPTAVADSNGDESWEVERITNQRYKGKRTQYLVRWKGYPPEEDTWTSRAGLADAAEILQAWLDR